jgi:hypothetical protein
MRPRFLLSILGVSRADVAVAGVLFSLAVLFVARKKKSRDQKPRREPADQAINPGDVIIGR